MDYFSAAAQFSMAFSYDRPSSGFSIYIPHLPQVSQIEGNHVTRSSYPSTLVHLALPRPRTLSLPPLRFDYSYNILANSIVGLSHNFIWASYSILLLQMFPFLTKLLPT